MSRMSRMLPHSTVVLIRQLLTDLSHAWRTAVLIDLLHKAIVAILIAPTLSILLRLSLAVTGRSILADEDILRFVFSPIGILSSILVGAILIGSAAFEQAMLMTVLRAAWNRQHASVREVLFFAGRRIKAILVVGARLVTLTVAVVIPFLLVALVVYRLLLSRYDINYYLQAKPPEFLLALGIGGLLLVMLLAILLPLMAARLLALPIAVFEQTGGGQAIQRSIRLSRGQRWYFARRLALWVAIVVLLSTLTTFVITGLVVPLVRWSLSSADSAITAVGFALLLSTIANFAVTLVGHVTLASMLAYLYKRSVMAADQADDPEFLVEWARSRQLSTSTRQASMLRVNRLRIALAVLGAFLVAVGLGTAFVQTIPTDDEALVIAHRGASAVAPENTLAAIQAAIDAGADWVEFDVQETVDGVVVVVHDSDLKKLGGDGAKIWEATAEQLRKVDIGSWYGPEFQDQRVARLDEVLAICKDRIGVTIELKYYGHNDQLEQRVIDQVKQFQMESSAMIISLKQEMIQEVRRLDPDLPIGLLTAKAIGKLSRVDADVLAVNRALATAPFVRHAHRRGKRVFVWTINDPLQASQLIGLGVDGIITDNPAMVNQVLEERREMTTLEKVMLSLAVKLGG
jgi:glycerophosphoryl diester phosphodiesterase